MLQEILHRYLAIRRPEAVGPAFDALLTGVEALVPDGKGGTVDWNVEMTAPAQLIRAGWKSSVMKPGDKVNIEIDTVARYVARLTEYR